MNDLDHLKQENQQLRERLQKLQNSYQSGRTKGLDPCTLLIRNFIFDSRNPIHLIEKASNYLLENKIETIENYREVLEIISQKSQQLRENIQSLADQVDKN